MAPPIDMSRVVDVLKAATLPNYSIGIRALAFVLALVVLAAFVEQITYVYRRVRYGLPGPVFVTPFIGAIVSMVVDPYGFWERQRVMSMGASHTQPTGKGASCNSIAGAFMVFLTDVEASRKVLTENGPNDFVMVLHPSGERILGPNNIAFQTGPRHKALRQSFLPLFSRKALSIYLRTQTRLIAEALDKWTSEGVKGAAAARGNARAAFQEMRPLCTELNRLTSQTVFAGPYIDDHTLFSGWYRDMTDGFLTLPVYFPGTGLWAAVEARKKVVQTMQVAAARSKASMARGEEPKCLLDYWSKHILEIIKEAEAAGEPAPKFTHDFEMAETMLDFMFAAQDASSSSLVWCIHYLTEHPDVLARVREEQTRVRPNDEPMTFEVMESMVFARQVVKEILRLRCPPPMVPHVAKREFQLTDDISVPKGALVIPSTWNCCLQGFTDPLKFDPDRMSPERREDVKWQANYIPFGTGPHLCVGREYAMNHLMAFLAMIATKMDWDRFRDGEEGKIIYMPSLYPGSCLIKLRPRGAPADWVDQQVATMAGSASASPAVAARAAPQREAHTASTAGWQRRWPSAESR